MTRPPSLQTHSGLDASDWLHQRRAFNHDWLKNRFLIEVGGWLNVLEDAAGAPGAHEEFKQACQALRLGALRDWSAHRETALRLLTTVEDALSPVHHLKRGPLRLREAELTWLSDVVHELWKARHAIDEVRDAGIACVATIDETSERLSAAIARVEAGMPLAGPSPEATLALLYDACYALATLIERLPRSQEVL